MKLLEYKEHEATNDMQRTGCLLSIIVSIVGWAIIIYASIIFCKYITQPFSSQEKVKHLSVVEETPRLVIKTECKEKQPKYYDIPLSHELQDYVRENCKTIKPELVFAVMSVESSFDPNAKNGDCIGLMQVKKINLDWLSEDWGITNLYDVKQNIRAGIIMLEYLDGTYLDNHMTLVAYNNGITGAERLFDKGIRETKYSRKVIERMGELVNDNL